MANEMQPDEIVGLTVAGLGHVRAAGPLVSASVHLLRLFGVRGGSMQPLALVMILDGDR